MCAILLTLSLLLFLGTTRGFQPHVHPRSRLGTGFRRQVATTSSGGDVAPSSANAADVIDGFCRFTNALMRNCTVAPFRAYADVVPAVKSQSFLEKITSAPQSPGLPRPVTLTIAASVPTALGWYGWYKFSVEEELFYDELQTKGKVTGCGGYGTLLPFVFLFLLGGVTSVLPVLDQLSPTCFEAGGAWILLGQINLYRRVNELCKERFGEEPLHAWWAILPPPLDVVVGLRQVHYLAKYWADVRGETLPEDVVAETYFPFISSERFTLREFVQEPRRWFWFTKEWEDFDFGAGMDGGPPSV